MGDGWFEGPELAAFFEVDFRGGFFDLAFTRVGSTHGDPGFEFLDPGVREARFGRHLEVAIGVGDRLNEEGFLWFSRDDGGAGIASGLPAGAGIEVEVGLEFFGICRVALVAILDEEWANVAFEVFDAFQFVCVRQKTAREEGESGFCEETGHVGNKRLCEE